MKILITSGGTTEPIDTVRGITNFATGTLGKLTAQAFLKHHQVILLAGQTALVPEPHDNLQIIRIGDTQNLLETMEKYVPQVDVVVHSMAVSDYRPVYMTGLENLPQNLNELQNFRPEYEKKISSKSDYQFMLLEKTPKIISHIKKWNSNVILFGFKLLSGVSKDHLLKIAREKLAETQADYIVANDLSNIKNGQHLAYMIDQNQQIQLHTKQEIAEKILEMVEKHG
jgi:phosphopantothenate-cysteine ligase